MNLNLIEKKIKSNGYYIYKNVFSKRKIETFKKKIIKILSKRLKKKESCGSELNQSLWNYFYEDIDNLNSTPINSSQVIYNGDILDNLNNLKNTSIEIGVLLDTQNENLNKINSDFDKINKKVTL